MRRASTGPASRVAQPLLVWLRPNGGTIEFPLDARHPVTIGRDASSQVVLPSTFVSRAHARLEYRDGKYLIEDLGSANGTKVNGAPVSVSIVEPGDAIELGSERLEFRDGGAARPSAPATGAGKTVRLALVAVVSLVVMGGALMLLRPSPKATTRGSAQRESTAAKGSAVPPAPPPAARVDSPRIREVLDEARVAGVPAADALYDRGIIALRVGRPREAADLFAAVLERDKNHALARKGVADAQAALQRAVADRLARADWLVAQFRFEEAATQWEQVLQLVDPADPRVAVARAGIDRARAARAAR